MSTRYYSPTKATSTFTTSIKKSPNKACQVDTAAQSRSLEALRRLNRIPQVSTSRWFRLHFKLLVMKCVRVIPSEIVQHSVIHSFICEPSCRLSNLCFQFTRWAQESSCFQYLKGWWLAMAHGHVMGSTYQSEQLQIDKWEYIRWISFLKRISSQLLTPWRETLNFGRSTQSTWGRARYKRRWKGIRWNRKYKLNSFQLIALSWKSHRVLRVLEEHHLLRDWLTLQVSKEQMKSRNLIWIQRN